jgi:hypothetical protein
MCWSLSTLETERREIYKRFSIQKLDGKRGLGNPRRRWKDNIKIHLKETGCGGVDGLI